MNYCEYIIEKYCDENINLEVLEDFEIFKNFNTSYFPLTFENYMKRIYKYCKCSKSCYYVAVLYVDKFLNGVKIPLRPLYKIFFVALILAIKWLDDNYYSESYYSTVSGIENSDLISLQMIFFEKLNYNMFIYNKDYERIELEINNYIEKKMKL